MAGAALRLAGVPVRQFDEPLGTPRALQGRRSQPRSPETVVARRRLGTPAHGHLGCHE